MTVLQLIKILETYDNDMQVIAPDGSFYSTLEDNDINTKVLYPDLTEDDNSVDKGGEAETYLMITTNQFN